MRNLGNLLEIWYVVPGVANALYENRLGLVVYQAGELFGVISFDKFGGNA